MAARKKKPGKTTPPRRRPKAAVRGKSDSVELKRQLAGARAEQAATAEILKVIASSRADVQPVFVRIVQNLGRLLGTRFSVLQILRGNQVEMPAVDGGPEFDKLRDRYPRPLDDTTVGGRAMLSKRTIQFAPVLDNPKTPSATVQFARDFGFNSVIFTPMIAEGKVVGAIGAARPDARPFDEREVALIRSFADQAVIAIENARLFNETKEALERQTATGDILKAIASSPSDVQPVFDAILRSAVNLCGAEIAAMFPYDGKLVHLGATYNWSEEAKKYFSSVYPAPPSPSLMSGRTILGRSIVKLSDAAADAHYDPNSVVTGQWRRMLGVPILRNGQPLGAFVVCWREPGETPQRQVELLQTFADQAVIAIENVRLFTETKEALERQTATAEILKVIASSPSDVQPVFDAIVQTAKRLSGAFSATVTYVEAGKLHLVAHTATTAEGAAALNKYFPIPVEGTSMGRAIQSRRPEFIDDFEADTDDARDGRELARSRGFRSVVFVPLMRGGVAIGSLNVTRREAGRMSGHQIDLLKTFADQAVIAIENVRLFNETKEALERQTATADILQVISGSVSDATPVFDKILASCERLFSGDQLVVFLVGEDEVLSVGAIRGPDPAQVARTRALFPVPLAGTATEKAIRERRLVTYADVLNDPEVPEGLRRVATRLGENYSLAIAPMLWDGRAIGSIMVGRTTLQLFNAREQELLKTFAEQAVIAIQNARMFNETKESLEQQTATAEILKVISESPTDTQPVFEAIVKAGLRLFPDSAVLLGIPQGGKVRAAAVANADAEAERMMMSRFPIPLARGWMHAEAILDGEFINFSDAEQEKEGRYGEGVKNFLSSGYKAITIAPMICGDSAIGAISVSRPRPGPLTEKQIALLRTFAAQAVIAIENVRVFKELEARTGALTRSVEQLTALGEVGQAISSTLDLEKVLQTIVQRAVQLTGLDGGSIYEYVEASEEFHLRAAENLSEEVVTLLRETPMRKGEGVIGHSFETGEPTEVPEMLDDSYQSPRRDTLIQAGYRALLVVPLRREDHIIGALAVNRKAPGLFPHDVVELLKTFATQSAMAIQNARLFREIAEKGKQLEVASRHKSDFLASMSHELRTPLNAILGFNEMLIGQVYGEVPADMQEPLADIQKSGKHLLRLINNVLDLAKIEAGRMELSLQDYSVHDTVESVRTTLRPLAAEKGLEFLASLPADIPLAHGDGGRITQCLMNLAGNALKFTKAGKVEISVAEKDGRLTYRVADTGIGIPPDKIGSLFTEFKQTDATIASEYGGTGLGLSISKQFIEMHGGRIWVESELGKGSAFMFEIPLRVISP